MKKTENLGNPSLKIEIHSLESFIKTLVQSKKLIIVFTALFSIITSSYLVTHQPNDQYRSTAVVEIGKFTNLENEIQFLNSGLKINLALETTFIQKLVNDNTKVQVASSIKTLGDELLILETTHFSKKLSIDSLNEMILYIKDTQEKTIENIKTHSVNSLDAENYLLKNQLDEFKIKSSQKLNIDLPLNKLMSSQKISSLQSEINEINEIYLPAVDDRRAAELSSLQSEIDEINEIYLPAVDDRRDAELSSLQREIDEINEISFPYVINNRDSELSDIERKLSYISGSVSTDIDLDSATIQQIRAFIPIPLNENSSTLDDNNLLYIAALNKEQREFEAENLSEKLRFAKASSEIQIKTLKSKIGSLNELIEITEVSSQNEKLEMKYKIKELQDSISEARAIEKIEIEKIANELDILRLSESLLMQQILDNDFKKLTMTNSSNYVRPSLVGQIITYEKLKTPTVAIIIAAFIISLLASIFMALLINSYRGNKEGSKN